MKSTPANFRAAANAAEKSVATFPKYARSLRSVRWTQTGRLSSAQARASCSNEPPAYENFCTPSWISPIPTKPSSLARFAVSAARLPNAGCTDANAEILSGWRLAKAAVAAFASPQVSGLSQYQPCTIARSTPAASISSRNFFSDGKPCNELFPSGRGPTSAAQYASPRRSAHAAGFAATFSG